MKTILDVSRYQKVIDWDAVKGCGLVSGVMLRALEGKKITTKKE